MGQLEVMSAIAPHARFARRLGRERAPLGWGYAGFLQALDEDPAMTGSELGQAIVDSYIAQDIRITDDQARALLTGGDYTAQTRRRRVERTAPPWPPSTWARCRT